VIPDDLVEKAVQAIVSSARQERLAMEKSSSRRLMKPSAFGNDERGASAL